MAITNVGFTGPVTAANFALMSQHQGALWPVVCGKNDLAVTTNPGATLTCTVAPGSSAGQGVLTTSSATESVTFGAVSTPGQTRWDAVVLRRNWASSGSASFVVVAGTAAASAAMVIPSGVDLVLDSTHDHLLALVQITYGNTVPTQVVDRRLQASKVFTAPSVGALPTASVALYGMEAVVGTARYRCLSDSGGSPAWVGETPLLETRTSDAGFPTVATGATAATVVVDRFTIAAAPSARTIQLVSSVYVAVSATGTVLNLVAFLGSTTLGYARRAPSATDQMVVVGNGVIPANTAGVIEVRLSRLSGTGAFSSSVSSGLTKSNLTLVRI